MNFKSLNELVGLCGCMINMYTNNERNGSCQVKRRIAIEVTTHKNSQEHRV